MITLTPAPVLWIDDRQQSTAPSQSDFMKELVVDSASLLRVN
jgi:hypothetical protein